VLLPSTHSAALLLLLLSFVCLGSWANTLRAAGGRWRFELYYFDFALGAILFAAALAWTLGTFGSELSFIDRTAVAGLRSQALAMGGGFVFSLGNMLLLATVSLLGMSIAFPLVFSVALIVWSLASPANSKISLLAAGVAALIVTTILAIVARRDPAVRKTTNKRTAAPAPIRKSTKGAIAGIIAGILIGISYPLAESAFWGDLGLGAYAGLLMFCIGIVISTAIFSLFFLNMAIEGGPLTLPTYLKGTLRQHFFGVLGGVLWSGGVLGWLLAESAPPAEQPAYSVLLVLTQGSALLAAIWGLVAWGELRGTTAKSKVLTASTLVLFACGLVLLAYRFTR
jgi:glucose uptake protein